MWLFEGLPLRWRMSECLLSPRWCLFVDALLATAGHEMISLLRKNLGAF